MSNPLTLEAIRYSWRELLRRAWGKSSINDGLVSFTYGQPSDNLSAPGVIVVPTADYAWQELLDRPPHSLNWLSGAEVIPSGAKSAITGSIPVLFWGEGYEDGHKPFAERRADGSIIFYADIIAATFFMLSRWEEAVVADRDEHGRFPGRASVAHKQGFLDRPIVDEYALILQEWLQVLLPGWSPSPQRFRVNLTHDIDYLWSVSWRTLAGDIVKRRDLSQGWKTLRTLLSWEMDPYLAGCYWLADVSERHNFCSAFYFKTADSGPYDSGHNVEDGAVRACVDELLARGHEIGFHPGYSTFDNFANFQKEKAKFDEIFGVEDYGGRQHYLRFSVPETWRMWERAGLKYDSTLGFPDFPGFRCGTCHPYQPFDVIENRQLDIVEVPLIAMDVTLRNYLSLTPQQGKDILLDLAASCQRVGGVFTMLWHNSSIFGPWRAWSKMYADVVQELGEMVVGHQ